MQNRSTRDVWAETMTWELSTQRGLLEQLGRWCGQRTDSQEHLQPEVRKMGTCQQTAGRVDKDRR